MRRDEFSVKDMNIIKEILDECEYGTLSLISKGKPYGVAVNFVFYNDRVFIHGAKEGRKVEAIKTNNDASFIAVKPYSLLPSYFSNTLAACPATQFFASVIVEGKIKELQTLEAKAIVLNKLMEKLQKEGGYEPITATNPMYTKMLQNTAVFELISESISCKVKAGQNLSKEKKENLVSKLEQRGESLDNKTISLMQEFE